MRNWKCVHINKMLYLYRFLDNWQNTTFERNKSIQDHLALGRNVHAVEFEAFNARRLTAAAKAAPAAPAEDPWKAQAAAGFKPSDVSLVVCAASTDESAAGRIRALRERVPGAEVVLVSVGGRHPGAEADKYVDLECPVRSATEMNWGAMQASRPVLCFVGAGPLRDGADPAKDAASLTAESPIVGSGGSWNYMVVPAGAFWELGGFDPRVDASVSVGDLLARAARKGWKNRWEGAVPEAAKRVRIRVVAIAKDEEGSIEGFFDQFRPLTTDFCLLDTGSTDRTVELAQAAGVRVESGEFLDFAQARNEALSRFREGADWLIMLDPDERLDAHTIRHLEGLACCGKASIYLAPLRAAYPNGTFRAFVPKPFLFESKEEVRWIFKVHEKLVGPGGQAVVPNAMIDHVIALHDGKKRSGAEGLYAKLMAEEPYFQDAAHKAKMREQWPILDYDRMDDPRLLRVHAGPIVSVVVPTYKRPALLIKALESVFAQDYANLDVVVVGDGCPDASTALATFMAGKRRGTFLNLPKSHGAGGAVPRNYAIALSAGAYIAYLDDDNEWLPDHVSSLYAALRESGAEFAFSSMSVEGKDLGFSEPKAGGIDTSCVLHKKSLVRKHGWWKDRLEGGYAHDWEFFSRWVKAGERWAATRKPTLLYNAATSGQADFLKKLAEEKAAPSPAPAPGEVLLTIVMPSIAERFGTCLPAALGELFRQAEGKPVEVKCVVDNKKQTLAEKRNETVAAARGRFVTFVDDDDKVSEDYVDSLLGAIRANPDADCVVFNAMYYGYTPEPKLCRFGAEFSHSEDDGAYYRKPNHLCAHRTELARKHDYRNYAEEDTEWAARSSSDIARQVRVDKVLYHYYYDPKSTTQGVVRRILKERQTGAPVAPIPAPSAPVQISVVIPTCGRETLRRTLASVEAAGIGKDDEVLVVGDGPQPGAAAICAEFAGRIPVSYAEEGPTRKSGNAQRMAAIAKAKGTHLAFIDDDDAYRPGALGVVRKAAAENPGRVLIFKSSWNGGRNVLWKEKAVLYGNIGSPMMVVPNDKARLGSWGERYEGDIDFLTTTLEKWPGKDLSVVWREDVLADVRPA